MFQGRNLLTRVILGLFVVGVLCGCRAPGRYYGAEVLQFRGAANYVLTNPVNNGPINEGLNEETPPADYDQEPTRTAEAERVLLVAK